MSDSTQKKLLTHSLPYEAELFLRHTNPWWEGKPLSVLPKFRRWPFEPALQRMKNGLAPVTVLSGPRQVGKTTIQQQIIEHLLHSEGVDPRRVFHVQFDDLPPLKKMKLPIQTLCWWFEKEIAGATFNEMARRGEPAYVFFDEAQNLDDWAPQVKSLVDHNTVRVLLTGSSALRIELGRDSLAGRILTLLINTLTLREIAALRGLGEVPVALPMNGLGRLADQGFWHELRSSGERFAEVRDPAFAAFSERGGYPIAQVRADRPWEEIADHLNEIVIRRVIRHDLRLGDRGRRRDPDLLEEVFRLCCVYAGQAPGQTLFISELRSAQATNVGWQRIQRIQAYLRFLNDTLLIKLVGPHELRNKKKKGRPKICLCDHSLRASWFQEAIPIDPGSLDGAQHLAVLAGHIAESVAGYFLGSIPGLDVSWFPERGGEPEVDFIITVGDRRVPIEVKYRRTIDPFRDTRGLRSFVEKVHYNAPFGVLVTLADDVRVPDPRIVALPLSSLLLMR